MTRMSCDNTTGFTLPELLAYLAIVTLLTLLAVPSFKPLLEQYQSRQAAESLYRFLSVARHSAVQHQKTVTVCSSNNDSDCRKKTDWSQHNIIMFIDHNRNGQREENDTLLQILSFRTNKGTLHWRSFTSKYYLQWHSNGMTYFQNGNILYCPASGNTQYAKQLILNAAGRVYFAEDNNDDGIIEGSNGKNIQC